MDEINNKFLNKLSDSESLVDILIQLENFIDNLDVYAFKNWIDGEIIDGPRIQKYWVGMTLLYQYDKMPDPEGAMVLSNHGAKISYSLRNIENSNITKDSIEMPDLQALTDLQSQQRVYGTMSIDSDKYKQPRTNKVWIIDITIPRIFIDELNSLNNDVYDSSSEDDMENFENKTQDTSVENDDNIEGDIEL
ncbi:MAG: hypothetical protein [Caudoviricetes sp.]|nr:MAG: hypothetical protein [Caudoviricetes sp.]